MVGAGVAATMEALRLDRVAAEVSTALDAQDCRSILLKGASTARWLYDDGAARPYRDVDLLVDHGELEQVGRILGSLGFTSLTAGAELPELDPDVWMRRANEFIDLHVTLPGVGHTDPRRVWTVLGSHCETWTLGGRPVSVLDWRSRSVVLALHALHHGPVDGTPMADLGRLIARLGPDDWPEVRALADRLGVEPELAAGLRLLPEGAALADALDLRAPRTTNLALKTRGAPYAAHVLEQFAEAGSWSRRLHLVWREVFPPPTAMRLHHRLAHHGRLGLAAAYVVRPFVLARRLPPGLRSWLDARRAAGPVT